jgi:hypothetical protein
MYALCRTGNHIYSLNVSVPSSSPAISSYLELRITVLTIGVYVVVAFAFVRLRQSIYAHVFLFLGSYNLDQIEECFM